MDDALIVIDIQNDYFPGGAMELEGATAAERVASELVGRFRRAGRPVVHVRHENVGAAATFFLPGTSGAQIRTLVSPLPNETVLTKLYPNAFRETGLADRLEDLGARRLTFCGMMTHMCVDTSVRAAFDRGFDCSLAADACATRALSFGGRRVAAVDVQAVFLAALGMAFARVAPAAEL